MGIYINGAIFGIRIYNFNEDNVSNILFEEKYEEIMSHEQMSETYLFYNALNDKNGVYFQIYTECISTHELISANNTALSMIWHPISLNAFLDKFCVSNVETF